VIDAFRLGPWLVEPNLNRVSSADAEVVLESKAMELLVYLAQRQGGVASTQEIIDAVWGGRAMGDNPVYKTVAKLRKALGDSTEAPRYIETIMKKGYRLVIPAETVQPIKQEVSGGAPHNASIDENSSPPRSNQPVRLMVLASALALIAITAIALVLSRPGDARSSDYSKSVAVLPFANFSGEEDDAFFADGLAEEILNRLAQSPDLRVVARTSSFRFRDKARDIAEIGAALDAAYLIEGSVRRDGDKLRVVAQLIKAETGYHVWSENFDNTSANIFKIQDTIALAVANALDARLFAETAKEAPTGDIEAWEMYLEGKALWQRKGDGPIRASIRLFENAIARDPEFAEAWAALSEAWIVLPEYDRSTRGEAIEKGRDAATRAIALNPKLAQPYLSLAAYENQRNDFIAGLDYTEKAFALEPHNTSVLSTMSFTYARAGWIEEALVHSRNGVQRDPLEGGEYITLGFLQMVSGDLDASEKTFLRVWHDLGVKAYFAWEGLFEIYLLRGDLDAAENWLEYRPSPKGTPMRRKLVEALRDPNSEKRDALVTEMLELAASGKSYLPDLFDFLLTLGAQDEAFAIVKEGAARGEFFMVHHLYTPFPEELRNEPRFIELAQDLGIAGLWRASGRLPDFCNEVRRYYDCGATLAAQVEEAG